MPGKNTIRYYVKDGHYHIYNRGIEKRKIFLDHEDYRYFFSLLESYTRPKEPLGTIIPNNAKVKNITYWRSKLEKDEVEIVCFVLMPNHFHFLLKQNSKDGITKFMRRISNAYVIYFNRKYERVGGLFQGKFKSVLIGSETYLLHLSRYIHLNPLEVRPLSMNNEDWLNNYIYSSYPTYLDAIDLPWVKKDIIMSFFSNKKETNIEFRNIFNYKTFVEGYNKNPEDIIGNLALEQ